MYILEHTKLTYKPLYSKHKNIKNTEQETHYEDESLSEIITCSIHLVEMKKQKIGIIYGYPTKPWYSYISSIRPELFPNSDDSVPANSCIVDDELYTYNYVCDKCNIERDEWVKANWQSWEEEINDAEQSRLEKLKNINMKL
jgi:hypothetical protein